MGTSFTDAWCPGLAHASYASRRLFRIRAVADRSHHPPGKLAETLPCLPFLILGIDVGTAGRAMATETPQVIFLR